MAYAQTSSQSRDSSPTHRNSSTLALLTLGWLTLLCAAALLVGCGDVRSESPVVPRAQRQLQNRQRPIGVEEVKAQLDESIHRGLDCPDCHAPAARAIGQSEDDYDSSRTRCSGCHEDSAAQYDASAHGTAIQRGHSDAARCVNCHGSHAIRAVADPRSPVSKKNLPETCGKCHSNPELARDLGIHHPEGASHYPESVHGLELASGNLKAPSCVDCHGKSHGIFMASDKRSTVNRVQVPKTCGQCHTQEVHLYAKGVHGRAMAAGNEQAPSCVDCHSSHSVIRPSGKFKLASDQICGNCHADRLSAYLETYHGRAHDLKSLEVAACFDCHGKHDILPSSDPNSTLSVRNRPRTCRNCHADAPEGFMSFMAHGDYKDREGYPMLYWAFVIMTSLIMGTFGIWGIHTFMWVARTLVVYLKSPTHFRAEKKRARTEVPGSVYVRFRPIDRFCHFLIIISFFLLVLTGMPLKFHDAWWAQWIFEILGGASRAAFLHRVGAALSGVYLVLHIASVVGPIRQGMARVRAKQGSAGLRDLVGIVFGPDSPLPNLQDLRDVTAHVRWFLGRGQKPKFDKFTYWEKFDYFAELWGSAFIGLSGLVMWFPEKFSLFVPGWAVNLAQIVHSQEALLAAGFILTFHFFNSHFRLEKFPLDTVMFSGRISEDEMRHERGRQLERLKEQGVLHEIAASGEWSGWKRIVFTIFGLTALVAGTILAVLMFWALGRLWLGA